jgi:hypothetical protein
MAKMMKRREEKGGAFTGKMKMCMRWMGKSKKGKAVVGKKLGRKE